MSFFRQGVKLDEIIPTSKLNSTSPRSLQRSQPSQLTPPRPELLLYPSPKMLRTPASSVLRRSLVRSATPALATRAASTHAISNPTLANIEKRWEGMPLQEQADLWMALRDRMKGSWAELTVQEKKAAYWIAFGPHGPRAVDPPGTNARVAWGVAVGLAASFALFGFIRLFAKPAPYTMTKEYQEASNELLIQQKADPFTGLTSENYKGKGMVQSPPGAK